MVIRIEHAADQTPEALEGKRLYIKSYGCQMNVYDAMRMADVMKPHGYTLVTEPEGADVVVLNTCHIREKADDKVFSDIGRLREVAAEDSVLAVGGCMGQAMGDDIIKRMPDVSVVFGPQSFHRLPEFLEKVKRVKAEAEPNDTASRKGNFFRHKQARVVDTSMPELEKFDTLPAPGAHGVSAFVSIQEGCDKFCTYCVVPYTRGPEISRPVESVLQEVEALLTQGVREVTLLGQNVNAFHGTDEHGQEVTFAGLIQRLAALPDLWRIRFVTSHPNNMSADLIALYGTEPKLMPYLHLPVQAGSDRTLQAMNRNHTAASYKEIIAKVREACPSVAIAGDFIVGFPGETEEDYLQTLALAAEINYAQAYSFAYSPRPGTPAAALKDQLEKAEKMERLAGLQALLDASQEAFTASFVGQEVEVLVEESFRDGHVTGRTPHNIAVHMSGDESLIGRLVRVTIRECTGRSLVA